MRIIAGTHRGRRLVAPEGLATRPMIDRVRENLFNLLGQTCAGDAVLDLFCGTGALGIEALSRGADLCTFVDSGLEAVKAVETNLSQLGLHQRARVVRHDALRPGEWVRLPEGRRYSLVFFDPPYRLSADPQGRQDLAAAAAALSHLDMLNAEAMMVLRTERDTDIALPWEGFDPADERSYGTMTLHLMTYRS